MTKEFYQNNRKKYFEKVKDNSMSVFFSGRSIPKSADHDYHFEVDKNFYYLAGINQENVMLVLIKKGESEKEILFIEENDPILSKWVGKKLEIEEARAISGIESVSYVKSFNSMVFASFNTSRKNTDSLDTLYLNLERRNTEEYTSLALEFAQKFMRMYPEITIANSYNIVIGLRMIKTDEEIKRIIDSIEITRHGIEELMRQAKAGMYEYQLEAYFDFYIKSHGHRGVSFETIAAAGKNATILHYVTNDSVLKDSDLVLFDLGTTTEFYISDISRTFPVSGKFSPRQREVYQEVLNVNKKCIDYLKPGISWKDFNRYASELLTEGCRKLGILKEPRDLMKYYWHSIGHFIGLDTHDPGLYDTVLQPGMVLTVEPGIYIEDEEIGVRIEDNVVITDTGCINLSKDIIKEVDDIEKFMVTAKR